MKKKFILILPPILLIAIITFFIIDKNRLKQSDIDTAALNQSTNLTTDVTSSPDKQPLSNNVMDDIESAIKEKLKN